MSQMLLNNVPKRILAKATLVNVYMPPKHRPKVLVLCTDCHLYEVERKEIAFSYDLSDSVLKDVVLPRYVLKDSYGELDCSISQRSDSELEDVRFGKYYTYSGCKKRLFILIKAFDKLVVVERTDEGFMLVKEYTNVDRFEVTDPDSNYRAVIAIYQNGLSPIFETFIENQYNDLPSTSKIVEQDESFSVATERISEVKTELAVQKVATSRQFIDLKDRLTFGPDQIRSDRIEEKQPLGKYGDIWMKISGEFLVIGIPVINNCSRRRQADIRQIESWIDLEKETLYCGSQLLTSKTIRIRITKDTEV